jgi:maltooligosyltrehalose trehalohydrolase
MRSSTPLSESHAQLPVGAHTRESGQVEVRLWAPNASHVDVVMDELASPLARHEYGWFSGVVRGSAGSRYGFQLDSKPRVYPDPASRFQPGGPHALSEVIDPTAFEWRDEGWAGLGSKGQVLYELHVGTFTAEGTWNAAGRHLERLRKLGVTAIQMMPIVEFGGAFGWGYDGVCWFAPSHLYGRPDDLRQFVDLAHAHDIGVVLDVVYNHLGPDGNYLGTYSTHYFTDRYENEWGRALNFDGPHSEAVREFVLASVEHWVREYHVDGFRLDATQQIFDSSKEHIITALVERARRAAGGRHIIVIGENEPQHAELLRGPEHGGSDLDGLYNDDFHHSARVALTGLREAYYSDYEGTSRELLAAVRHGFLYQGQRYTWQQKTRGTPALDRPAWQFLHFLENHDQVANSAAGRRLSELASPGQLRALTALLLLGPATPLLFQGQEIGATSPFVYFAHHEPELARQVLAGRQEFLNQFERYRSPAVASRQRDPAAQSTFEACKLAYDETERSEQFLALHRDLLTLRRNDPAIASQGEFGLDGATLNDRVLILRFSGVDDRLLVVNLGTDVNLATASEPLVAPPAGARWHILWSSEDPAYGGSGTPAWTAAYWRVAGNAALLLGSSAQAQPEDDTNHVRD